MGELEYRLSKIYESNERNAVFEAVRIENEKQRKKMKEKSKYELEILIEEPKRFLTFAIFGTGSIIEAREIYENWDVLEMHEYCMYNLAKGLL